MLAATTFDTVLALLEYMSIYQEHQHFTRDVTI